MVSFAARAAGGLRATLFLAFKKREHAMENAMENAMDCGYRNSGFAISEKNAKLLFSHEENKIR